MSKLETTDINALVHFARVVQAGGFSSAARRLGLPRSRLSRQVAELERHLGVQLLQRSTRRIALTETGRLYYAHCARLADEAEAAQEVIDHLTAAPRGRLRVVATPTYARRRLAPLITEFLLQYPGLQLQLEVSNRDIDIVAEGIDIMIRARVPPLPDSPLVARSLGISRRHIVASPALLDRLGPPDTPAALTSLPCLALNTDEEMPSWQLRHHDGQNLDLPLQNIPLATGDLEILQRATLDGLGFALLPSELCAEALEEGRLISVLEEWEGTPSVIQALYATRKGLLPSVQAFLDFLSDTLSSRYHAEHQTTETQITHPAS